LGTPGADAARVTDAAGGATRPAVLGRLFLHVQAGVKILTFSVNPSTGALGLPVGMVDTSPNPIYLAVNAKQSHLYSANDAGRIASFTINQMTGTLTAHNDVAAGGAPVYASVHPKGTLLVTGNYGGSIWFARIAADGKVEPGTQTSTGERTHSARFHPSGKWFYAPAVGAAQITQFVVDEAGGKATKNDPPTLPLAGLGPRHIDFTPDGKLAFVINERPIKVTALKVDMDKGTLSKIADVSALGPGVAEINDFASAEIAVSPDGKRVYASVRHPNANNATSQNTIAIYDIDRATGGLKPVGFVPTGNAHPRGFVIDPTGKFLFVAHETARNVVVFRIDPATGMLTKTGDPTSVPGSAIGIAAVNLPK
jgi:6-phosphogluconolactonase